MTTQSTIDKLIEMRLTSMSDAFRTQMEDPRMKGIPFEDRFGMLVDIEYSNRSTLDEIPQIDCDWDAMMEISTESAARINDLCDR